MAGFHRQRRRTRRNKAGADLDPPPQDATDSSAATTPAADGSLPTEEAGTSPEDAVPTPANVGVRRRATSRASRAARTDTRRAPEPAAADVRGSRDAEPPAPDASTTPVADVSGEEIQPTSGDRDTERGLRGLVGPGSSQVSLSAAARARDAARPTDEDLLRAERELTVVRRNWVPREPLRAGEPPPRRAGEPGPRRAGGPAPRRAAEPPQG